MIENGGPVRFVTRLAASNGKGTLIAPTHFEKIIENPKKQNLSPSDFDALFAELAQPKNNKEKNNINIFIMNIIQSVIQFSRS